MRQECLRWQKEIRDIGLVPEAEIEIREATIDSRFEILRQVDGESMVERLVDVASRASQGVGALDQLLHDLQDSDAAIRCWGATGIGNCSTEIPPDRENTVVLALIESLRDLAPDVRIAAARALCRIGKLDVGLPVLQQELASQHQWGRLSAAIVLDELDEAARPALRDLQGALSDQPNKYIIRVANKAVNDLLGTANEVP